MGANPTLVDVRRCLGYTVLDHGRKPCPNWALPVEVSGNLRHDVCHLRRFGTLGRRDGTRSDNIVPFSVSTGAPLMPEPPISTPKMIIPTSLQVIVRIRQARSHLQPPHALAAYHITLHEC